MDVSEITIADFKAHFVRDFSYGSTTETVMDADLNKAFAEARANFNQSLFGTDEQLKIAFFYLAAHYLVTDLQNASAGLSGSGLNVVASRSVGSVSESYAIPEQYLKDPILSFISKTGYGQKYLSLVLPLLIGNVQSVAGWTEP